MTSTAATITVSEKLTGIFNKGLTINQDILFFAESTYGISSTKEFLDTLSNDYFEDREVLLGLIFSPDRSLCLALESLIGGTVFTKQDEQAVIGYIGEKLEEAKLIFPDSTCFFYKHNLSAWIKQFVQKLYLRRLIDPQIILALDKYLPESVSSYSKMLLRFSAVNFSENTIRFFCDFIKQAAAREDRFLVYFEMVLSLIDQVPEDMAIEEGLFHHRLKYETMLHTMREFELQKKQYGMEYLLMSRFPIPHESEDEVREKLKLLNTVIFDILGYQPRLKPVDRELGTLDPKKDMGKFFRMLE